MSLTHLKGRRIVVTDADRGIGLSMYEQIAKADLAKAREASEVSGS